MLPVCLPVQGDWTMMAMFWPRSTLRPWQARYETRERAREREKQRGAWARLARRVPRVHMRLEYKGSTARSGTGCPMRQLSGAHVNRSSQHTSAPKSTERITANVVNLAPVSVTPHRSSCRAVRSASARNSQSIKRVFGPPSRSEPELAVKVQFVAVRLAGCSGTTMTIMA